MIINCTIFTSYLCLILYIFIVSLNFSLFTFIYGIHGVYTRLKTENIQQEV